jgi:hypothetical protein
VLSIKALMRSQARCHGDPMRDGISKVGTHERLDFDVLSSGHGIYVKASRAKSNIFADTGYFITTSTAKK